MDKNVGDTDTIVRYVLAIIFILLGFIMANAWWFLVALIAILTAFFGWCPIYKVFGINTNKSKELQNITIPSTTTQPTSTTTAVQSTSLIVPSTPVQTTTATLPSPSSGDQIDSLAAEHASIPAPAVKVRSRPKKKAKAKPKKVSKPVKKAVKKSAKKKKK